MFANAIVKKPCKALVQGITSASELGIPDYERAVLQHEAYIAALKECGVTVTILEADENFPDSCFVEDTAVITKACAIITSPGTATRNKEAQLMLPTIRSFFPEEKIEYITSPGTLDGGDVMMVGDHFYIGLSRRTNTEGAQQFIAILERYGFSGSEVTLDTVLHLKTGASYIENNNLLVYGEFAEKPEFAQYDKIVVPPEEAYAANCVWMNDKVIVPKGYPITEKAIRDLGYEIILIDTSEFKKLDGGLTCLSLRF
ncbi:MAG: arginine deiminase family protein [Coriobacteriia bacterium]|nr:arginine deiminase family protein [Coriobacteriia bacterium]MCL2606000.1 arginine deiminase family protein [Coriobacteriia bacterium]